MLIEEVNLLHLKSIKNIPKIDRYNVDGSTTPKFRQILDQVYSSCKTIFFENLDLTSGCDSKLSLDPKTYLNMYNVLNKYKPYLDKCSIIVIEQQMQGFKGTINRMAMKLGQHCYSYFVFTYRDTKDIIEFPAYHKTSVLGAPKIASTTKKGTLKYKSMTKTQRKKWAIDEAINILHVRGDMEGLSKLQDMKKKDDCSDCLLMCLSYVYLKYVDKTI